MSRLADILRRERGDADMEEFCGGCGERWPCSVANATHFAGLERMRHVRGDRVVFSGVVQQPATVAIACADHARLRIDTGRRVAVVLVDLAHVECPVEALLGGGTAVRVVGVLRTWPGRRERTEEVVARSVELESGRENANENAGL